jgi:hypothetical protein
MQWTLKELKNGVLPTSISIKCFNPPNFLSESIHPSWTIEAARMEEAIRAALLASLASKTTLNSII